MSLPLSGFTPPMKHTPTWDMSGNKSNNIENVLTYIKRPKGYPLTFPLYRHFLVEIAAPVLGLIIAKIFFLSIPNTVLLSIITLTPVTTLATSIRALYVFADLPFPPKKQQLLQNLLQCLALFMHGLALTSPSPSPLLHITIPLLTIFFIVWPFLLYIRHISPIFKQHLTLPSLPLFCCSVASLFGSVLHSLLVRSNPWTSYLQLASCVSITLLCKDSITELESHRISSFIKRVIHLTLCLGVLAYQAYSVFVDPVSANIISALLVSTHIFFVLFIDRAQDIRDHNSAFRFYDLCTILFYPLAFGGSLDAGRKIELQDLQEKLQTQPSVAPWYFPVRALLYVLLGTNLLFSPLPIQPVSILLKVFFLSQIISNMTDCILKQIEASVRKREWDHLIEKMAQNEKLQEEGEVQKFLQSVTDNAAKHPNPLGFSLCVKLYTPQ